MKKKLLDRRGAAIELAIMMMVFSIFITTILLTTALLQNDHKAKAELGIQQDILLEQLGEDFVEAVLKGEIGAEWKPSYDGIAIENNSVERHQWVEGDPVEATCEEDGYTPYTCTLCGETKKEDIVSQTGHSVAGMNCKSFVSGECDKCHTEVTVRAEHKWGDWEKSIASTCTGKGTERRECEKCDAFLERELQALSHSWNEGVLQENKKCEDEDGMVFTCTACGDIKIEAGEHVWDKGTPQEGKSCADEDGSVFECAVCKITKTGPTPHIWEGKPERKDPSCTAIGETIDKCSNELCNAKKVEKLPATGHSFGDDGKCTKCETSNAKTAYTLTVIAVERDSYKIEVLERAPEAESCETAVLQIVLEWSAEDNAYKITEWSKK